MIYLVASEINSQTWSTFLSTDGARLQSEVRVILPHEFATMSRLPVGTYFFLDPDLWTPWQLELLTQVWSTLESHGGCRLFNDPRRFNSRVELQRLLVERGTNPFRTFRASSIPDDLEFPVFLRYEDDHKGSRSPLLNDWAELEEGLTLAGLSGADKHKLLVCEFCETVGPDRLYRKFGVFRVGDAIIPRLINFDRSWIVKSPAVVTEETVAEERRFIENFHQEQEIREIFDLAGVDFGRVDYTFDADGRMRAWEVNPNPLMLHPSHAYKPMQRPILRLFLDRLLEVLDTVNISSRETIPLSLRSGVLPELSKSVDIW